MRSTQYEGTVLLVSHDRELLRTLTTRVWVLHDRHITDFDGNFRRVGNRVDGTSTCRLGESGRRRGTAASAGEKEDRAPRGVQTRDRNQSAARRKSASKSSSSKSKHWSRGSQSHARSSKILSSTRGRRHRAREAVWASSSIALKPTLERAIETWGTATEALDTLTPARS